MPAKKEGLSRLTAAFNIVKCNWGIGMMAMPYSTHNVPQCSTPFPFQSNDSDERKLESVRFRTSPPPLPQRQRGTIWAHAFKQCQHSRALGVLHVGYTPLALVILLYISAISLNIFKNKRTKKKP